MNRWARRHAASLTCDLDDNEALLGANRVVLVSASSITSWRPPRGSPATGHAPAPATRRLAPGNLKLSAARRLGFPLPGWICVLGVTDRRLVFWHASALLARPRGVGSALGFDQIAAVRGLRRLGATRLSIVLDGGAMLVVQALWSRHLADLATAFDAANRGRR